MQTLKRQIEKGWRGGWVVSGTYWFWTMNILTQRHIYIILKKRQIDQQIRHIERLHPEPLHRKDHIIMSPESVIRQSGTGQNNVHTRFHGMEN